MVSPVVEENGNRGSGISRAIDGRTPLAKNAGRLLRQRRGNLAGKLVARPKAVKSRKCRKTGAGEGIRTLDPNLGKVVLYP